MAVMVPLLLGACASTPESRLRIEIWDIYWLSARACDSPSFAFYVDNVKLDGTVTLLGHSSTGIDGFRECYWKGVQTAMEKRRASGLPLPDAAKVKPDVEIDLD